MTQPAMSAKTDELSVLREHLERMRAVTLQTLDLVPDDLLGWKPMEGLRSFAETFLHIAQTEDFYVRGLFQQGWDMARFARPQGEITREMLLSKMAEVRARTLEDLDRLAAAALDAPITVPGIPVPWPLRGWLWYLVEHEMHHKAQLALYLRHIGVVPPFFAAPLPKGVRPDVRPDVM